MSRRLIAVLVAALIGAVSPIGVAQEVPPEVRYDNHKLVRTMLRSQADLDVMLSISRDHWSESVGVGAVDFRVSPEGLATLDASGIPYVVLIENVQLLIDTERQRLSKAGAATGPWFADFKDYDAVNAQLNQLVAQRPDLATLLTVGTSLEGRTIQGIRITGPGRDKPAVFFNGCQHAREWIAVMVPMYIADRLVSDYDTDPVIQDLVDRVEFIIVPIVNPDGYVHTWGPDRLWRKNRRDNGDGTFGVDPNRNWDFGWGGAGSSGITNSETYRGTAPFSEPETQALRDLFLANPQIVATIDFHSYQQLVLSPWGYIFDLPPDADLYDDLGGVMSDAIFAVHGFSYVHGPASIVLYQASGISIDWTYGDRSIYSFTIELRPNSGTPGFILPPEQIIPTAQENLPAVLYLAEWATQGVQFTFPNGLPTVVEANTPAIVPVDITPTTSGPLVPASAKLFARTGVAAPFAEAPLSDLGGGSYEATLPPTSCGSVLEFYFEVGSVKGILYTSPGDAPSAVHPADAFEIETAFSDDFETDLGWAVQNGAGLADGAWDRGVPAGGGDRGDPPTDADGSGSCYLTDNVDGNSDVDGGTTTLTSPIMDATGDPTLSYSRWFHNSFGGGAFEDTFVVEVSDNGGLSWINLETVGPAGPEVSGGWFPKEFALADVPGLLLNTQFRVRFIASDLGAGSVVEAGVDAVKLLSLGCTASCPTDVNGDGSTNVLDLIDLLLCFGMPAVPGCESQDVNGDGAVNVLDLIDMLLLFGTSCP